MCLWAPVVRLAPVVDVACALGPLLGVKLPLNGHQLVAHAQGPAREAALPAGVPVREPDAGEHVPPAETTQQQHPGLLPSMPLCSGGAAPTTLPSSPGLLRPQAPEG